MALTTRSGRVDVRIQIALFRTVALPRRLAYEPYNGCVANAKFGRGKLTLRHMENRNPDRGRSWKAHECRMPMPTRGAIVYLWR